MELTKEECVELSKRVVEAKDRYRENPSEEHHTELVEALEEYCDALIYNGPLKNLEGGIYCD